MLQYRLISSQRLLTMLSMTVPGEYNEAMLQTAHDIKRKSVKKTAHSRRWSNVTTQALRQSVGPGMSNSIYLYNYQK